MMEKTEGSEKSMEDLQNSSGKPPWIELLDPLIEEIIGKLPLVDYIRFGAICKRWNSIQKEHRARYSPKPPPITPSVVLVKYHYHEKLWFNLPFEQKKYHLPVPYPNPMRIFDSCCGWFLTHYNPKPSNLSFDHFHVYNPITGVTIDLPLFSHQHYLIMNGSLSASPADPNCCVIITTNKEVFVLCLRDFVWKKVHVTSDLNSATSSKFVYINGKFYGMSSFTKKSLSIVDPYLLKPTEQVLELEIEEMMENNGFKRVELLTVIDGELFLVIGFSLHGELIKGFHVFRANFSTRKWIREAGLGDYAVLLADNVMSLHVSSVEGFRKNMIYFPQILYTDDYDNCRDISMLRVSWMTFDMDSQEIAEGPSFLYGEDPFDGFGILSLFWFFPTI